MRLVLATTLAELLDETGCLGVGLVDGHGLILQSSGFHAGFEVDRLAPNVLPYQLSNLEGVSGDRCDELILVGEAHTFVVRRILRGRMVLYAMFPQDLAAGPIRFRLGRTAHSLEKPIEGSGLLATARQRLEQPQKFPSSYLIG